MSLDQVVRETVAWLEADGLDLSPYVVKATVQVLRRRLDASGDVRGDQLFDQVHGELRGSGVLLQRHQVERVVRAYATLVALLDIRDTSELPG